MMTVIPLFPKEYYGSRGRRLAGYLADRILLYGFQVGGMFAGGIVAALMTSSTFPREVVEKNIANGMSLGWLFWGATGWFLNYGILQGLAGASIGKFLCGLRVVDREGASIGVWKSLLRTMAYMISALPLGVGFLAILWDEKLQCWHDALCRTYVVKKGPRPALTTPSPQLELFSQPLALVAPEPAPKLAEEEPRLDRAA